MTFGESPAREGWRERWEREQRANEERRARYAEVHAAEAAAILVCDLRVESMRGVRVGEAMVRRECFLCGETLPPRMRRWCSTRCSDLYWRNHGWTTARQFALLATRIPDVDQGIGLEELWTLVSDLPSRCRRCGAPGELEVNHREPRLGAGYGEGCHHHQSNLEPLCHPCHVAETTRQTRERLGIPLEGRAGAPVRGAPSLPLWGEE